MAKSIPWARVTAEGLIIVVSVLVGLGIDAWWDDRQATHDARRELEAVVAELGAARSEIERGLGTTERLFSRTVELRKRIMAVEAGQRITVPDTLIAALVQPSWVTDAPTAMTDAFIASGHLAQLGNAELRRHALGWSALLQDMRGDELRVREFRDRELAPYLVETFDVATAWPGRFDRDEVVGDGHPVELRATLQFRNLVTQTITLFFAPLGQSPAALAELDLLVGLAQAEIAGGAS